MYKVKNEGRINVYIRKLISVAKLIGIILIKQLTW